MTDDTFQPLMLDDEGLRNWPLPRPDADGDKEHRGAVLVIAGSAEMPGAAILAGVAALRAGAGKLLLATARSVAGQVATALPEARVVGLAETSGGGLDLGSFAGSRAAESDFAAVLIGPGMVDEAATIALAVAACRVHSQTPVLLDAFAMGAAPSLAGRAAGLVLTPHAGEMAHLLGITKEQALAEPMDIARSTARRWQLHLALKGACTFVAAPTGECWRHEGGHVGLATCGSGDVLAGLIAGLLARGAGPSQATCWGVALHARAGESLLLEHGGLGLLASEIASKVPRVMHGLSLATPTA